MALPPSALRKIRPDLVGTRQFEEIQNLSEWIGWKARIAGSGANLYVEVSRQDEVIIANTDLEVVMSFLRGYQRCIMDIREAINDAL